jgi:putative drug exporter of the RND superfamily
VTRVAAWLLLRLRLLVVPAWILVAYLATAHLPAFTQRPESAIGGLVPAHSRATQVEERGVADFGTPFLSRVEVVERSAGGLGAAAEQRAMQRAVRIDRHRDPAMGSVGFALPITNAGAAFPSSHEHGTTVVTYLYFPPDVSTGTQLALAHAYVQRIRGAGDPVVGVTGAIPAREAEFHEISATLKLVEAATVGLIALVLLVAFRALGPPVITLGAAALSYLISVRVLTWLADALKVEVPREVQPVLVALLLGLTTDYSVFFFADARRRLVAGEARVRAATQTLLAVLPIIVTAGLIVAVGSASLVVGKLGFFRAFGPGMAVTVLVTLAVAVTLVPAVLATLGRAVFWPGLARAEPEEPSRLRRAAGRVATFRPVALALAVAAIVALAIAASQDRSTALGLTILRGLPSGNEVRRAADAAGRGFAPGIVGPTEVLLEGSSLGTARPQLDRLQHELGAEPGVAGVVGIADQPPQMHRPLFVNAAGTAARFGLVLDDEPLSTRAIHTLRRIEQRFPVLLARAGLGGVHAGFAGDTALADDTVRTIHSDITRVALALLLANFVLLALFLRALLAPLYLLAASVLGLAASLGVMTWLFQTWLGHQDITYYVPFAAAVLLLSLGSDYNVFITGRIWQEAERRPFREAIRYARPRASRTIAIAGITLAASFALVALIPIRAMRELAFVMATGILIDSFLVRSLLVPSLMATFGRASWWPNTPPELAPPSPASDALEPARR